MTAKTALIIIFSLFLAACDQQPETDWDSKGGYDYFTLGDMRTAADLRRRALEGTEAYAILEDLVTTAPNRLPGGPEAGGAGVVAATGAPVANVSPLPWASTARGSSSSSRAPARTADGVLGADGGSAASSPACSSRKRVVSR